MGTETTYSLPIFGSDERHHIAYGTLSYMRMPGGLKRAGHWYSGNWELQVELFGGGQYNSESDYVVGFMLHLRYHFATGSHLVTFIDAGFGVSLTDIIVPDLGAYSNLIINSAQLYSCFVKRTWPLLAKSFICICPTQNSQ